MSPRMALSPTRRSASAPVLRWALLAAAEYEVENHFQFQLYSNSFPGMGNDQSHSRL